MCNIDEYGLTEVNQKEFNRCRNRLLNEATRLYNLTDMKSIEILEGWISEKINEILKLKGPQFKLDSLTLQMLDINW